MSGRIPTLNRLHYETYTFSFNRSSSFAISFSSLLIIAGYSSRHVEFVCFDPKTSAVLLCYFVPEMEDELMEFSGDMPDPSQPLLQDGILSNDDFMNSTMVQVSAATTTIGALFTTKPIVYRLITHVPAPFLPYTPNFYRIAALSVRCLLALLVLVLSGTIKRDFLKIFTLLLLLPIVLDCGFDVYTEIKTSVSYYGSR